MLFIATKGIKLTSSNSSLGCAMSSAKEKNTPSKGRYGSNGLQSDRVLN